MAFEITFAFNTPTTSSVRMRNKLIKKALSAVKEKPKKYLVMGSKSFYLVFSVKKFFQ